MAEISSPVFGDAAVLYLVSGGILMFIILIGTLVFLFWLANAHIEARVASVSNDCAKKISDMEKINVQNGSTLKANSLQIEDLTKQVSTLKSSIETLNTEKNVDSINHASDTAILKQSIETLKAKLEIVESDLRSERMKNIELTSQLSDMRRNFEAGSSNQMISAAIITGTGRLRRNMPSKTKAPVEDVTDSDTAGALTPIDVEEK